MAAVFAFGVAIGQRLGRVGVVSCLLKPFVYALMGNMGNDFDRKNLKID